MAQHDAIANPLDGPSDELKGPVGEQDGGTEAGKEDKPDDARRSAASNRLWLIGVPKRMAGSANTGRASNPATPRSEKAVSPPTASPASMPLVANIRNCTAAPAAAPPGMIRLMALPGQLGRDHWEPGLGPQRDPLEREGAGEVGRLGDQAAPSQMKSTLASWGNEVKTAMIFGATTYRATPAMTTTMARLTTAFHERGRGSSGP